MKPRPFPHVYCILASQSNKLHCMLTIVISFDDALSGMHNIIVIIFPSQGNPVNNLGWQMSVLRHSNVIEVKDNFKKKCKKLLFSVY